MTCTKENCEICASQARRKSWPKMSKAQLREELAHAEEAYMDASEWASMCDHYIKDLERHLSAHGCEHNLAAVSGGTEDAA